MNFISIAILMMFGTGFVSGFVSVAMAQQPWQTKQIKGVTFVIPKGSGYANKIDFAELERRYPVSKEALKAWTQEDIAKLGQEDLDQLYARLTAGPIPDGAFFGDIVFTKDGGFGSMFSQFTPNWDTGKAAFFKALDVFGQSMWKGKHFYRQEGILRNLIADGVMQTTAIRGIAQFLLGAKPDMSKVPRSKVGNTQYMEMFPAKLFCGQSLLDSRRESIIIDYAYGDNVSNYVPEVDRLATREGVAVRDEIRMVRPGLYLGRAYMRQAFGLIFSLYNAQAAQAGDESESCWTGTQPRK